MHWALFLLLLGLSGGVRGLGYCVPTGCAGTGCTCPAFFFRCDTAEDMNGVCTFTTYGVWAVVAIIVLLLAAVAILVVLVCCCCCCRCCKPGKTTKIMVAPYEQHSVI